MTPEEVPDELVEAADLALATGCTENENEHGAEECICPSDYVIRTILAAALPARDADTQHRLVKDLEWLADARSEYGEKVESEIRIIKVAARVLNGGWYQGFLPSWAWDQWQKHLDKKG